MGCNTVCISVLCMVGAGLSLYAAYIGAMKKVDPLYRASCDLDDAISCSHVITSKYSTGLGVMEKYVGKNHILNMPNSYFGIIFFPLLFVLGFSDSQYVTGFAVLLCFVSSVASAYLLYILLYIMEKICLVCLPVHVINLVLFIVFTLKVTKMPPAEDSANAESKKDQ